MGNRPLNSQEFGEEAWSEGQLYTIRHKKNITENVEKRKIASRSGPDTCLLRFLLWQVHILAYLLYVLLFIYFMFTTRPEPHYGMHW